MREDDTNRDPEPTQQESEPDFAQKARQPPNRRMTHDVRRQQNFYYSKEPELQTIDQPNQAANEESGEIEDHYDWSIKLN